MQIIIESVTTVMDEINEKEVKGTHIAGRTPLGKDELPENTPRAYLQIYIPKDCRDSWKFEVGQTIEL